MLLVYLDESYKPGRDYWIAACAVHESKVADLCADIRAAAARIPATFGVQPDVELHAQHLYHGDGEFQALKRAVRTRVQAYRRGLEAVRRAEPRLFFSGVAWNDNLPLRQRLSSHRLAAFRRLLPCLEEHCADRDEHCLVIADEEETTAEEVVAVAREHQSGMEGRVRASSRILDTPLFAPSYHSHGIQACDLVAFLRSRRAFARPDEDSRATRIQGDWWEMIAASVVMDECAAAPTGVDSLLIPLGWSHP